MKFQVRDGYVVRFVRKIEIAEDKFQDQEVTAYGGQVIDLDESEAQDHAHKLEPVARDKDAAAFLEAKVLTQTTPAAAVVLDAQQQALIQAVAQATALEVAKAMQSTALPAATPATAGS